MLVRGFARTIPNGDPVPNGTQVEARLHADNSLLGTVETQNGMYTFSFDGSPGPYYIRVAYEGETHISSSKVVGMSGPVDIGGLPLYFRLWDDGYIPDVLNELAVSANGTGMQVAIAPGVSLIRGVLYDQPTSLTLPVAAASGQKRIDRVVIEVVPPGAGADIEGRSRLIIKQGTPSASPTPPALTQTLSLWEHPLATITVDPAVSSIASNKVGDERKRAIVKFADSSVTTTKIADGAITSAKIADDAVTMPKLAAGAVTSDAIATDAIVTAKLANGSVTGSKIGTNAVTAENIAPNAVTASQIAAGAVNTDEIADSAVTGAKIAGSQITSSHIVDGTIAEADLAVAVRDKLNAEPGEVGSGGIANGAVTTEKIADSAVTRAKLASGAVTKADIGLGNVDNTSDASKPISSATQTALNGKAATSHTHTIANITSLQTELNGKAATSHTHSASEITSGVLNLARVPVAIFPFARNGNSVNSTTATSGTGELAVGTSPVNRPITISPGTWRLSVEVSGLMWRSVSTGHFYITVQLGYYNASLVFTSLSSMGSQLAHGVGTWPSKDAAQRYTASFDEEITISTTQSMGGVSAFFRGNDTAGTTYMGNASIIGTLQKISD